MLVMGDGMTKAGSAEIVVIEKDLDMRLTLSCVIRELVGKASLAFADEEAAIRSVNHPGTVRLLIVDIVPPFSDSRVGLEKIRRSFSRASLIAMSGTDVEQRALLAGACAYLHKPFSIDALVKALDTWSQDFSPEGCERYPQMAWPA